MINYVYFQRTLLVVFLLSRFSSLSAFIYTCEIWSKLDAQKNVKQYVYCLSDMHIFGSIDAQASHINHQHKQAFFSLLKSAQPKNTLVIVHDELTYTGQHKTYHHLIKKFKENNENTHFISFLARDCDALGFDVVNVECRFERITGAGFARMYSQLPAEQITKKKKRDFATLSFTTHGFIKEFEQAINQIRNFNDGSVLSRYYCRTLEKIHGQAEKSIAAMKNFKGGCWKFLRKNLVLPEQKDLFANGLIVWGMELLDARALHAIVNAQDKKEIFVVMGGMHIKNINQVLPQLGYQKVYTYGQDPLTKSEYQKLFAYNQSLQCLDCIQKGPYQAYEKTIQAHNDLQQQLYVNSRPLSLDCFKKLRYDVCV